MNDCDIVARAIGGRLRLDSWEDEPTASLQRMADGLDGKAHPGDPRQLALRLVDAVEAEGLSP